MERDIYLEKKRVYGEKQDGALEDRENDEPAINSKHHHHQIKNLLKCNFYIPRLDSMHLVSNQRKIQGRKSAKITDEEHDWWLVLRKPLEAFDVNLFFQCYLETIQYILKIEDVYTIELWSGMHRD